MGDTLKTARSVLPKGKVRSNPRPEATLLHDGTLVGPRSVLPKGKVVRRRQFQGALGMHLWRAASASAISRSLVHAPSSPQCSHAQL
jgi:hypothetical protein